MRRVRVGILGCGFISDIYLKNLTGVFRNVEVRACADLDMDRARARAEDYCVPLALTPEELYAHGEIDLIVNLTTPRQHYDTTKRALRAGKHVYGEKPLAACAQEGRELVALAEKKA